MEFHQHSEEEEEETEIQLTSESSGRTDGVRYRYKECLKNQAVGIGKQAVDGCLEFMAAGGEGTLEALKCAACNCHRNFHRKEPEQSQATFQHHHQIPPPAPAPVTYYYHHHHHSPAGYLHVNHHHPPLALPSTTDNLEETSNPASSSGGGGGDGSGRGRGGSKKRFRTKFTESQKERMLVFAEGLGWRIQKEDEGAVQQFCDEIGIRRKVLKVWMHNNKHTLGKKP